MHESNAHLVAVSCLFSFAEKGVKTSCQRGSSHRRSSCRAVCAHCTLPGGGGGEESTGHCQKASAQHCARHGTSFPLSDASTTPSRGWRFAELPCVRLFFVSAIVGRELLRGLSDKRRVEKFSVSWGTRTPSAAAQKRKLASAFDNTSPFSFLLWLLKQPQPRRWSCEEQRASPRPLARAPPAFPPAKPATAAAAAQTPASPAPPAAATRAGPPHRPAATP